MTGLKGRSVSDPALNALLIGSDLLSGDDINVGQLTMAASVFIKNPKYRAAVAAGGVAYSLGEMAWKKWRSHRRDATFIIKIQQADPMYDVIQRWLIESLAETAQKNVIAFSLRSHRRYGYEQIGPAGTVEVAYDGARVQEIEIDGHSVSVQITEDTNRAKRGGAPQVGDGRMSVIPQQCLLIECPNIEARRAVLARLREEADAMTATEPKFRTAQRWGDFATVSDIPIRPLETVVLKAGQAERVIDDLKTFLTQEDAYVKLGVPYRRGLLLEGPPGTGKTSLASAITHELGLDVYYISLSALESDNTLAELLGNIEPRSVLLLEDVDCVNAAHERSDKDGDDNGVTTAGLLNALDGFNTPHGMITIMTTNHIEVLDEALIRPGRVDLIETISAIDHDQLERMCLQYIGHIPDGLPTIDEKQGIMPAEIIGVFKKTIANDDQHAVGRLLVDVLNDRVNKEMSIADSLLVNELIESE